MAALGLAACGGDDDATSSRAVATDSAGDLAIGGGAIDESPAAEQEPATEVGGAEAGATELATGGSAPTALPFDDTFGQDLIIEMGLTMSTPNVQATLDSVRALALANGGRVYNADVRIGEELDDGSVTGGGTVEIGIPPDRLDELVDDLDGVARVTNVEQSTQDVTEQLIDLEIRIRQARTGIAQIEVLYGQATEFDDLIEIERELARRQVDLERLLAAERGVEGRVAVSKLTVTIAYEPRAVDDAIADESAEGEPGDGIADAFRSGWEAFAGALFAVGFVVAIAAPFIALGLFVLLVAWLVTRLRNGRRRLHAPRSERVSPARAEEPVGASHED